MRTRTALDNATPSGAATMVGVLARLRLLTGETAYRDRAEATAAAFGRDVAGNPASHAVLLLNLDLSRRARQVVVAGRRGEADADTLLAEVWKAGRMDVVVAVVAPGEALPDGHPAAGKNRAGDRAAAYVCDGPVCSLPVAEPGELAALLA